MGAVSEFHDGEITGAVVLGVAFEEELNDLQMKLEIVQRIILLLSQLRLDTQAG